MKPAPRGFTLIEMVLVVMLIGVFFGVASLRFDHLTHSSRLRASAREVGSTVGLAYSEALVQRRTHVLVFDTARNAYWVEAGTGEDAPESAFARRRTLYRGVRFRDVMVGDAIWDEGGEVRVDISPLGVSTRCLVHLANEEDKEMTVRIHPLTGTVSYEEGYVDDETWEDEAYGE